MTQAPPLTMAAREPIHPCQCLLSFITCCIPQIFRPTPASPRDDPPLPSATSRKSNLSSQKSKSKSNAKPKKIVRFTPSTVDPTPKCPSRTVPGAPAVDTSWRGNLRRWLDRIGSKNAALAHFQAKKWHRSVVKAWAESDREEEERMLCVRKWVERGRKADRVALYPGVEDPRGCDGWG